MRFLLDTHTFIWLIQGDVKLGQKARETIETPENELYFSIASVWEITIKLGLGKLEIAHSLKEMQLLLQQLEIGIPTQSSVYGLNEKYRRALRLSQLLRFAMRKWSQSAI